MILQEGESFILQLCRGRRVAVVASGPILADIGKEIDAHDVVIRINIFDLTFRPENAGRRLTCWVHNGHLGKKMRQVYDAPHLVPKWYGGKLKADFDEMDAYHRPNRMYFFRKETIAALDAIVAPKALTTGGRILAFLLRPECEAEVISMYGYSFYDDSFQPYEIEPNRGFPWEELKTWHDPIKERQYFLEGDFPNLRRRLIITE